MNETDRKKWNQLYKTGSYIKNEPADVLAANMHLLPQKGKALDLACGLGANAMLLAAAGLDTHAWDISDNAIAVLRSRAELAGLIIHLEQRDVLECPPAPESFDLIIVSRFLDRHLVKPIINALRTNGLLFYQTFTRNKQEQIGPDNPDYLLARNELLSLYCPLQIVFYREDYNVGMPGVGNRNEAMLVAQKI